MHVVIIIAGIADAKRPLQMPVSGKWVDLAGTPTTPFKLSPFDEAALEIGLKLRDKDPSACLTAVVTDGASDLQLLRAVASFRVDKVIGLQPGPSQRGNPVWLSAQAMELFDRLDQPVDLALIGREHGDMDDGMLPAYLAETWSWPFVCQALQVESDNDGGFVFKQSKSDCDEAITLHRPVLASISNDKSNRLRHPLMKNVMLAKQQTFEMMSSPPVDREKIMNVLKASPPATSARGEAPCKMLNGTVAEQAESIAAYLNSWRVA